MVARRRPWIMVVGALIGLAGGLGSGCRDFSDAAPNEVGGSSEEAGSGSDAGSTTTTGGASDAGTGSRLGGFTSSGEGGTGLTGEGGEGGEGGAGGPPGLSVAIANAFDLPEAYGELMPFLHPVASAETSHDAPHFIAYRADTGAMEFRRLEADRRSTTSVWSDLWEQGLTFTRVLPAPGQERFGMYAPSSGKRLLATFQPSLAGPWPIDPYATEIEPGYTHRAGDLVPAVGLAYLYWYDAISGRLRADMLNAAGDRIVGGFVTKLPVEYHALAALDGHVLGFDDEGADVFDHQALNAAHGTGEAKSELFDLGPTESVVAFHLGELSLLLTYSFAGEARIHQLLWSEEPMSARELWSGALLLNARTLTGLGLPGEFLLFAFDPVTRDLQLTSVSLAPP